MEQVLEQTQLRVPPDERGLQPVRTSAPEPLGDHAQGAPRRDRRLLALEHLVAGRLEGDRTRGGALGRLADEHGPGCRDGLEPRRGVHEIAGDHALVAGAEGDGRLAGHDPRASVHLRTEGPHGVDDLEGRPDGALRVVLAGDRRAPDGHDGVPDELLDGAAVAGDDVAGEIEVRGQQFADRLGVAALGEAREPDEVGEEDGDEPSLGDGSGGRAGPRCPAGRVTGTDRRTGPGSRRPGLELGPALPAEPRPGRVRRPARRARRGELGAALVAELAAGLIDRAA